MAAIATDFSLGRVWKRDIGANTCRGLKAGCTNPAGCSSADVLRRPWQDAAAVASMPARPQRVEFAYGAEQTSHACGVGYFTCHGESKMCKEEQKTWEPMDTTPMRKVWYDCTPPGFCQQLGLSPYSPRCAGALLAVWTSVWKHSPWVPNTTLSTELAQLGQFDNSALGWYDPSHAAATLSKLSRQAAELLRAGATGMPWSGVPPRPGMQGRSGAPLSASAAPLNAMRVTWNCSALKQWRGSRGERPPA